MNKLHFSAQKARQKGMGQLGVVCPVTKSPFTYTLEFVDMSVNAGLDILFVPFMTPQVRMPWMMGGTEQTVDVESFKNGITTEMNLEMLEKIRDRYPDLPIVIVSFFNDILAYGIGRFVKICKDLKIDGVDTPGYSFVTNGDYTGYGRKLAEVRTSLIHPISTELAMAEEGGKEYELLEGLIKAGDGFVFIMADSAGKSGATGALPTEKLRPAVKRIKELQRKYHTECPVITVCGVSSVQNVREAVEECGSDGALMASSVIRKIQAGESLEQIGEYIKKMKQAMYKEER